MRPVVFINRARLRNAMIRIAAADGTPLAVDPKGGAGGLLLVHGSGADHTDWDAFRDALGDLSSYAMDRCGRGESGDHTTHSLAAEVEDVCSMARTTQAASVMGHSYGALVVLEAAKHLPPETRIILYEPPILDAADPPFPAQMRQDLPQLLDDVRKQGTPDVLAEAFMRQAAGATDEEIELLRSDTKTWDIMVACAHTLPREARAASQYPWEPKAFSDVRNPTVVLVGTESPSFFLDGAKAIVAAMPHAHLVHIERQGHNALNVAPQLVANLVRDALEPNPAPIS